MKIGIDYGGVITFNVEGYADVLLKLKEKGHEVFLVSHAINVEDAYLRQEFCGKYGIIDNTFVMDASKEDAIRKHKAEIVTHNQIDLFIDDSRERCQVVADHNTSCTTIFAPQESWDIAYNILKAYAYESN